MPQEVERGEVTAGKMRSRWRNSEISATTRARILVCAPYIGDSLRSNDSRLPRFPPPHPGAADIERIARLLVTRLLVTRAEARVLQVVSGRQPVAGSL